MSIAFILVKENTATITLLETVETRGLKMQTGCINGNELKSIFAKNYF